MPPIIWSMIPGIQNPLIITSESDVEVLIGTNVHFVRNGTLPTFNLVRLNCSLHHQAIPNTNFTWSRTKNDQPIDETDMIGIKQVSENGSLLIINVTGFTGVDQYCCKAESIVARDTACSTFRYIKCEF